MDVAENEQPILLSPGAIEPPADVSETAWRLPLILGGVAVGVAVVMGYLFRNRREGQKRRWE